jgi:hypothetical protein
MKTKINFIIFFLLIIMSCSQMEKITNATLYNYSYGITIELNDKQLGQLNELMDNGLTLTNGMKWIYLRTIKFSYGDKKDENEINLFEGDFDYYYIEFKKKYYKVKEPYKHILIDFKKESKGHRPE